MKEALPSAVRADRLARARRLEEEFLAIRPEPDPRVSAYWTKYQAIFGSGAGVPQDLKDFANSPVGASPGNMSVFNQAWNHLGPGVASLAVREAVDHLLHGPDPLEDRLTYLIKNKDGMPGFRETLLTKVLAVMDPERFLTILKYSGAVGKQGIAHSVYGLELPDRSESSLPIGHLIVQSNDLLRDLTTPTFPTARHASSFLWWARSQP
ncbi:MAG: hypothetical protein QOH84_3746 [Kribbellaceae bacterium]|jgi:hypothetical protein|nr:hypothetical protein [Kribbellaceae bacterium]